MRWINRTQKSLKGIKETRNWVQGDHINFGERRLELLRVKKVRTTRKKVEMKNLEQK